MTATRALPSLTLVTQYFPPERGAAQVRLGSIVKDLVSRGLRVSVVTAVPNYPLGRIFDGWSHKPVQTESDAGATIRRVWVYAAMGSGIARMVNYASFGLMSMVGLCLTRRTDWLVVEYPTLFGALPAVVLGRLRRQRVILIVADLWVDSIVEIGTFDDGRLVGLMRAVERWMLTRADNVTAVTDGVRDALIDKGVDPSRLVWLPNGADTDLFSPGAPSSTWTDRLRPAAGEHLFLYAGTHGYVHGMEVLLDAARILRRDPVRFVLVGDGSEKPALRRRAAEMELSNVEFMDPVSPEDVAGLLSCATGALASVREGDVYRTIRSAKAIPAMASATPVLYSGDDEGSRLVSEAGAGLAVPPGDATALADAVRRLIDDEELRVQLGNAGRQWVLAHASWHRLVGDWLDQLDGSAGVASVTSVTPAPGADR